MIQAHKSCRWYQLKHVGRGRRCFGLWYHFRFDCQLKKYKVQICAQGSWQKKYKQVHYQNPCSIIHFQEDSESFKRLQKTNCSSQLTKIKH